MSKVFAATPALINGVTLTGFDRGRLRPRDYVYKDPEDHGDDEYCAQQ
ncbi:hypothetical protein P0D88_48110 [Paraburkholderia sp. RL18-103-BIB-C]